MSEFVSRTWSTVLHNEWAVSKIKDCIHRLVHRSQKYSQLHNSNTRIPRIKHTVPRINHGLKRHHQLSSGSSQRTQQLLPHPSPAAISELPGVGWSERYRPRQLSRTGDAATQRQGKKAKNGAEDIQWWYPLQRWSIITHLIGQWITVYWQQSTDSNDPFLLVWETPIDPMFTHPLPKYWPIPTIVLTSGHWSLLTKDWPTKHYHGQRLLIRICHDSACLSLTHD